MNLTRDRAISIAWLIALGFCGALLLALTFRVNAVKSQVRLTERQIVAAKREKQFLETEFLTRANQQQLRNLNDVEFGYEAPRADQYIEGERQLAALGKPRAPGAPPPIRVASAAQPTDDENPIVAMVSPLTGTPMTSEAKASEMHGSNRPKSLAARLGHIDHENAP